VVRNVEALQFPDGLGFEVMDNRLGLIGSLSRIVRWEFMGNWLLFWLLCVSLVGIPVAILYLVTGTLRIEEEVEDAQRFIDEFRSRKNK
jgi:hypothetical protein